MGFPGVRMAAVVTFPDPEVSLGLPEVASMMLLSNES